MLLLQTGEAEPRLWQYSSPKKSSADANCSFALIRVQQSAPDSLQQPCAPARVHKDETAWTVALYLNP